MPGPPPHPCAAAHWLGVVVGLVPFEGHVENLTTPTPPPSTCQFRSRGGFWMVGVAMMSLAVRRYTVSTVRNEVVEESVRVGLVVEQDAYGAVAEEPEPVEGVLE